MGFLNASSVVTLFIAAVLFFEVAPHVGVLARRAALAVRAAAVGFTLSAAWSLLPIQSWLYRLPNPELGFRLFPLLCTTAAWGCLAWAVFELVAARTSSTRPTGGPELR